jgi:membrane-bound lytic murein transglycosylase D
MEKRIQMKTLITCLLLLCIAPTVWASDNDYPLPAARSAPAPTQPPAAPKNTTAPTPAAAAPAQTAAPVTAAPVAEPSVPTPVIGDNSYPSSSSKPTTFDLWHRMRTGFAMPDLQNDLVQDREQWYSSRPDYIFRMTERSRKYLFHIVEELERRKMPTELALLPFVESAFNPQAVSSAKAAGMWQFIPSTGKNFSLKQNILRDDRRDVLASTRAALDYLQKLHNMFGDWHLALAAYNWGEGSVQRAIKKNQATGLPTSYTDLSMPNETRYYVPKLQAIKNIVMSPEAFNSRLPDIANHPYFARVNIKRDMDVALAARLAEIKLDDFRALNPSANKPVILAAGTPYVLLPWDNAEIFQRNLQNHGNQLANWTVWIAPSTMRSADAAKRVGMSEAEFRDVNRIPPRMLVKAGSTLLVTRSVKKAEDVSEQLADNAQLSLSPEIILQKRTVRAGKRDTVASVAARYKVSAAQVASWNKTSAGAPFKHGQAVVLYLPVKAGSAKYAARHARGGTRHASKATTKVTAKASTKATSKKTNGKAVRVAKR